MRTEKIGRMIQYDFTVDEGGSAEPTRDKNIIHRHVPQEGVQPAPLLCDPGWVV